MPGIVLVRFYFLSLVMKTTIAVLEGKIILKQGVNDLWDEFGRYATE